MNKNTTINSVRRIKTNLNSIPTACGTLARNTNTSFYSCKSALVFLEEMGVAKKIPTSGGVKWTYTGKEAVAELKEKG